MKYFVLALVTALSLPLPAQEIPGAASPVTGFRAAMRGEEILLSWELPPDQAFPLTILRSASPIGAESFGEALRVAELAPTSLDYVDRPPAGTPWFYAILALPPGGTAPPLFSPGLNATSAAVTAEPPAALVLATSPPAVTGPKPAEGASPAPPPPPAPGPTSPAPATPVPATPVPAPPPPAGKLLASVEADAIVVNYDASPDEGRLALYRGTGPFSDAASLLEAALVASVTAGSGRFVDYPVPGIDYWYALIPEESLKSGRIAIRPGVNASASPARIPSGLYRVGLPETSPLSRTPPLPPFFLEPGLSAGPGGSPTSRAPGNRKALGPEAGKAVSLLLAPYASPRSPTPPFVLLPPERGKASGGEDYSLALIVRDKLQRGQDAEAATQLRQYLSLNRGPEAQDRARFYLGVALARSGTWREAVFELLLAREAWPRETAPWLDYAIGMLRSRG